MAKPTNAVDYSAVIASTARLEEESLFSRDIDGRLIRLEKAKAEDFDKDIQLTINGRSVTVKKAVPTLDSEGDIIRDPEGRPIPRYTTIYDAASLAFVHATSDVHPIPTLCHREHLPPVGVCRVCIVEAAEMTKRGPNKKLVPACVQHVSAGMEVHTFESQADPEAALRVRNAAQVITELMLADHAPATATTAAQNASNELVHVAKRLGIESSSFSKSKQSRGQDNSSFMIQANHDECIMCGRCQRGCNWVKENRIIGRAEKGYEARISFDLNNEIADSGCVSCGECVVSCPTGALTFTDQFLKQHVDRIENELGRQGIKGELVTPEELLEIDLFGGLPMKFLQLNAASVVRRVLSEGEVLCREGDYGATAFIMVRGSLNIFLSSQTNVALHTKSASGLWGWLGRLTTKALPGKGKRTAKLADLGGQQVDGKGPIVRTVEDRILGEMSCLNRSRRSATMVAREETEVLEIRRNVLDMLLRNRASREILDAVYRKRIVTQLSSLPIFADLDEDVRREAANWLKERANLVRVDPGQPIFRQGDLADHFYLVSLGFVKVSQTLGEAERVVNYLGPGSQFGEIALLSQLEELQDSTDQAVGGRRTASCSALDHVELFQITGDHFKELLIEYPVIRQSFLAKSNAILERDRQARKRLTQDLDQDFLDQGLYGAQNLLVIDLEQCTRCDECTKACADTHQGVTRLIRDGMRYDRFLIASSCRSCMDPYCMVGCPVDAIHRNGESLQIEIEDYCIGCGLCAENCPYGNINMHGFRKTEVDPKTGKTRLSFQEVGGAKLPVIQQRATTCDLCMEIDGRPSCVHACPHNAAFRVDSDGLRKML